MVEIILFDKVICFNADILTKKYDLFLKFIIIKFIPSLTLQA